MLEVRKGPPALLVLVLLRDTRPASQSSNTAGALYPPARVGANYVAPRNRDEESSLPYGSRSSFLPSFEA